VKVSTAVRSATEATAKMLRAIAFVVLAIPWTTAIAFKIDANPPLNALGNAPLTQNAPPKLLPLDVSNVMTSKPASKSHSPSEKTLLTFLIRHGQSTKNAANKVWNTVGSQLARFGLGKGSAYHDAPLTKKGYDDALNLYVELQKELNHNVGTCNFNNRNKEYKDCCASVPLNEKGRCYFSGYAEMMSSEYSLRHGKPRKKCGNYVNLLGKKETFRNITMTYAKWMSSSRSLDATSNLRRAIDTYAVGIGLAGKKSDKAKAVMIDSDLQEFVKTVGNDGVSKIKNKTNPPPKVKQGNHRQAKAMGQMCQTWFDMKQTLGRTFVAECTNGMIGYINGFYEHATKGYDHGHYVDDSSRRTANWAGIAETSMTDTLDYIQLQHTQPLSYPVAVLSGHSNFWKEAIAVFGKNSTKTCQPLRPKIGNGGVLAAVWTKTGGNKWEIKSCKLVLGRWQD